MEFSGYASTADRDYAGHVVAPGAFDESIRRRGLKGPKAIKLLAFHDSTKPVGTITKLETQRDGRLLIEGEINEGISYGKDLAIASKAAGGLNFSVGFYLIDADWNDDDPKRPYLHILKGELTEVSVVVFPCNEEATMTATEKLSPIEQLTANVTKLRLAVGRYPEAVTPGTKADLAKNIAKMKDIFE